MADSLRMLEAPSPSNENLHLQLCINDLLYPTEKSEILLEALTATQLEKIEKTINKIKTEKQFLPKQTGKKRIMTHKFFVFYRNLFQ